MTTPADFRAAIRIDRDGVAVPFQPDDWQEQDFLSLDQGWMKACGMPTQGVPISRAWLERPRGSSKTSDLAMMASWALALSPNPIRGIAAASDMDQAKLLRDAIARLCRFNGWLNDLLDLQAYKVVNRSTGSELAIISSDVASSWGHLPDFIVCDELTHWVEGRGQQLWESLLSSAAKKSTCLLLVIGNAGFMDSWVWPIREAVRCDPDWFFHSLDGSQASWISPKALAEQQRLLPPLAFDRLWQNLWVPGAGDALSAELIEAAVTMTQPPRDPEIGWSYCGGLDLSLRRDRSAFVVVGRNAKDRIRLAHVREWKPKGGTIDLVEVQRHVLSECRRWQAKLYLDPYQGVLLEQQLATANIRTELVPFVGTTLHAMATTVLEVFRDCKIELWRHESLLSDLRRLRIIERPQGFRLDAPRTTAGHADIATALTLALYGIKQAAVSSGRLVAPAAVFPDWVTLTPQQMARNTASRIRAERYRPKR